MDQKYNKIVDIQQTMMKSKNPLEEIQSTQIFGLDKNITVLFITVIMLFVFSYYLYREFKKMKDEVRNLKSKEVEIEELIEKVNVNGDSVKAIEIKLDQLIYALTKNNTSPPPQKVQTPPPQVQVKQPVVESDDDYETDSDDGIIRQPITKPSTGKEIKI